MKSDYEIIRLETVDSTNTYLKNHPELWDRQFCTVITNHQTGGRGRHSRVWQSKPGKDLTFSLLFIPAGKIEDQAVVTIIAGLAVYRALSTYITSGLNLKWPNDIFFNDKKIGGILCEMIMAEHKPVVIIGIGININSQQFPEDIAATAASLQTITGSDHDPVMVFNSITDQIIPLLREIRVPLEETILSEWVKSSRSIGSDVSYFINGEKKVGTISRINNDGSLHIQNSDDSSINGYRGEVFFSDDV